MYEYICVVIFSWNVSLIKNIQIKHNSSSNSIYIYIIFVKFLISMNFCSFIVGIERNSFCIRIQMPFFQQMNAVINKFHFSRILQSLRMRNHCATCVYRYVMHCIHTMTVDATAKFTLFFSPQVFLTQSEHSTGIATKWIVFQAKID